MPISSNTPRAPTLDATHLCIEVTFERVVEVNNLPEMGPAQLCPQCGHNLDVGEDFCKAKHAEQVSRPETTPKLDRQLAPSAEFT